MASRLKNIESLQDYLKRAYVYYETERKESPVPEAQHSPGQVEAAVQSRETLPSERDTQELSPNRPALHSSDWSPVTAETEDESVVDQEEIEEEIGSEHDEEGVLSSWNLQTNQAGTEEPPELDESWDRACEYFSEGRSITCLVTGWNRGGLLVRWGELQGFVPTSQLKEVLSFIDDSDRETQLARRVGEELQLRVIELDPERNRLVLSERALMWNAQEGTRLLESLNPGDVRQGRVSNLCNFGAFVDLGGVDGLIHISELAWRRVSHPREVLEIGQELDVYVLDVDQERRRVALSLKRLRDDPWLTVGQEYRVGQIVQGTITNVVSFGAFARIEDGLEGLIHISELGEGNFIHPRNVVQEGDMVSLRVLRVDSTSRRIGLSLRLAGSEEYGKEKE